jgi:hypothetical protein
MQVDRLVNGIVAKTLSSAKLHPDLVLGYPIMYKKKNKNTNQPFKWKHFASEIII